MSTAATPSLPKDEKKTPPAGVPPLEPGIRRTSSPSFASAPGLSPSITGAHADPPAAIKIKKARHIISQAATHLAAAEKALPDLLKDIEKPIADAFGFDLELAQDFLAQAQKTLDTVRK